VKENFMKAFWRIPLVVCGLLLFLGAAAPASAATMYGWVWVNTSVGTYAAGSGYTVKFCSNSNGTGPCYQGDTYYNCFGNVCGPNWYQFTVPAGTWYFYAWKSADYIGSSSSPAQGRFECQGCGFGTSVTIGSSIPVPFDPYTFPAPLPPSAVYPTNGAQNIPTSFTLKWSSGVDTYRTSYPTVYDVWAHGEGGADVLQASNASCNPDASGNCTLFIPSVLSSSYIYWHVVAKSNPGIFPANPYYTTSSQEFTFTTATNPNALVSFLTGDLTHYLTGAGCGGGALTATSISQGGCESFKVIDLNGGNLISGESVNLQLGNVWYAAAENGGGSQVNVNRTSAGPWESFTVIKLSGAPGTRILHGDRIAFQTSNGVNYVSAYAGGGSSVDASATSAGSWETFIYTVH
jgi:hypothetical protein